MIKLLQWRYAGLAEDLRQLRQAFTCARPPKMNYSRLRGEWHPKRWELDVQSWFRGPRPVHANERLLLGMDDRGIGAFAWWSEDDGPADVMLKAVAVDCRYRGQGEKGKCGPAALELHGETVGRLQRNALDAQVDSLVVTANVHRKNKPSRQFCEHMGFTHAEQDQKDKDYEIWTYYEDL